MRSDRDRTAVIALVLLALAGGCSQEVPVDGAPELETGYWQARITLPGGDIDTAFEIGRSGDSYRATLINGQERVRIREVSFSDGNLKLRFPAFNNEINARLEGDKLIGTLTLVKRYGEEQIMPFVAIPGGERIGAEDREPAAVDLSGRWDAEFHKQDGSNDPSIGEFAQRGSRLFGTFLNPTADYRYLAGYVRGNTFQLSTFDGAHAYVFAGQIEEGVINDAGFWSGTGFHQNWSAKRDQNATLPDAYKLTYLNPDYERFDFEFPNLAGERVSLGDERFRGKVVIVNIAGTWCPNCHDEAELLAALYKEYRSLGLEVVALMYEHFEDQEIAIQQIRRYREKFDIQFETLVAGISDTTEVSKTLPSLNAVLAFPTTIFIDRSGSVRVIHTGFSGPGTGKHYEQLKNEITGLIDELIEEPFDLAES
jgi:thiol-disulfide isomerase/thioredoxin